MISIVASANPGDKPTERLPLSFEMRSKNRLRTKLDSGEEVCLFLARGTVLRGGDLLCADDGRIIEVVAAPEHLLQATSNDPLLLARAAYHLGNRHVAVQIATGRVIFAADHVLGAMIRGLGLPVTEIETSFEPEAGAYGGHGGHAHHDGSGQGNGARIHEYSRAKKR